MNNLYEALESCLQDIEKGADVEAVLVRYPDLANELRPILETSVGAKSMAVPVPSPEVMLRNRAKVLQYAAQMREARAGSSQRGWAAPLRRLVVTLAVVTVLFVSGTGLVRAAANTLPGDSLYPVKRTWEDVSLLLTFDSQQREMLELEHENKRLYETKALLEEGRSEEVDFNGRVTSQNGNEWVVAGIRVLISNQTEIRDQGITVGDTVRIRGVTQGNDTILAERIRLLSDDAKLPDAEDGHKSENDNEDNSGPGSGDEGPRVEETETPESDNSGPGSGTNTNENDNGNSGSNNDDNVSNDNSGSGGQGGGNDNSNDDDGSNSGSGNGDDEDDNEDNSGSGGGGNSGPGGGGGSDEDNSGPVEAGID
jgi:uncharacterized membrane protein YgcG